MTQGVRMNTEGGATQSPDRLSHGSFQDYRYFCTTFMICSDTPIYCTAGTSPWCPTQCVVGTGTFSSLLNIIPDQTARVIPSNGDADAVMHSSDSYMLAYLPPQTLGSLWPIGAQEQGSKIRTCFLLKIHSHHWLFALHHGNQG